MQAGKGALHIARSRQVIDAVEAADGGVDRFKQPQLRHRLAQKQRRGIERGELLLRLREHFGGIVDARDRIAAAGEERGHRARAAGEVEQRLYGTFGAQEEPFDKVCPPFVVHVLGQLVVGRGESLIAVHGGRPLSRISRIV